MKSLKQRQAETGRTLALNGAPWRRLRAAVLADEPLCRYCHARSLLVPATDVDHINNDPTDNHLSNLQPLCHECHSRKTASDYGKRVSIGCDVNGFPQASAWQKSPATDRPEPPSFPRFNGNSPS